MGYIKHDAVIVVVAGYVASEGYRSPTAPAMPDIAAFRESLPASWRRLVVGPVKSQINDYLSFAFLPDGSKEGWSDSDAGDRYRTEFAELFSFQYEDGSSPFDVMRIRFGGDDSAITVRTLA